MEYREGNEFRVDGENKEQGPFTLLYLTFTLKHLSMHLVFARLRRLSHFYFCDTPVMAAIFCYSGDSSDSVIATFSGNSDGLSHHRPTDSKDTCGH